MKQRITFTFSWVGALEFPTTLLAQELAPAGDAVEMTYYERRVAVVERYLILFAEMSSGVSVILFLICGGLLSFIVGVTCKRGKLSLIGLLLLVAAIVLTTLPKMIQTFHGEL